MIGEQGAFLEVMWLAGLLLLRVGVPVLVIASIALVLRRVDRRWQMEADALGRAQLEVEPLLIPQPLAGVPCFEQRQCGEAQRAKCAASRNPTSPCWLSRSAAEGGLPATCTNCGIFRSRTVEVPVMNLHTSGDVTPAA